MTHWAHTRKCVVAVEVVTHRVFTANVAELTRVPPTFPDRHSCATQGASSAHTYAPPLEATFFNDTALTFFAEQTCCRKGAAPFAETRSFVSAFATAALQPMSDHVIVQVILKNSEHFGDVSAVTSSHRQISTPNLWISCAIVLPLNWLQLLSSPCGPGPDGRSISFGWKIHGEKLAESERSSRVCLCYLLSDALSDELPLFRTVWRHFIGGRLEVVVSCFT